MNRVINWLQSSARQIITVFLVAITFLVIPAFNQSQAIQAQAAPVANQAESPPVDRATVKRIQEKAEDLGDAPGRRIGDTGLENIKELGKKIPETIDLNLRQKRDIYEPTRPATKDSLDKAQNKAEKDFK